MNQNPKFGEIPQTFGMHMWTKVGQETRKLEVGRVPRDYLDQPGTWIQYPAKFTTRPTSNDNIKVCST